MNKAGLISFINENGGWISSEQFMNYALYDKKEGYYSRHISHLGYRGDFSTAATLSGMMAKSLIARYRQRCAAEGESLAIIEIGGGDGSLARDIWRGLGLWERWRTSYYMVETSSALRDLQKRKMGRAVTHFSHPGEALCSCKGRAFIFSNELVDAFPARVFQFSPEGWMEVGVRWEQGKLTESCRMADNDFLPESSVFDHHYETGQRVEVHESYDLWCGRWADFWKAGEMVTIDYGSRVDDLYYRRPMGSFRGYCAHNRMEGAEVYLNPGHMDLTCDVNFTDLESWGRKRGWETEQLLYQRDFLLPFSSDSNADRFLTNSAGAGNAFMVLIQKPSIKELGGGVIPRDTERT